MDTFGTHAAPAPAGTARSYYLLFVWLLLGIAVGGFDIITHSSAADFAISKLNAAANACEDFYGNRLDPCPKITRPMLDAAGVTDQP